MPQAPLNREQTCRGAPCGYPLQLSGSHKGYPYERIFTGPFVVVLALIVLVALGLLLTAGIEAPLHEDEAIYAAWANTILTNDPLLLHTPVDKPPLFLYVAAGTFSLTGMSATALRVTNLIIMVAVVLLTTRLNRRPAISAVLLVSTPLVVFFAAGGFTDPLMLLCILAGWYAARRGWSAGVGLACAGALLAKPTAVFLLPLIGASLWSYRHEHRLHQFLLALTLPLAVVWAWDASRAAPSWWQLGRQAYGTLGRPGGIDVLNWAKPALVGCGGAWLALATLRDTRRPEALVVGLLVLIWIPLHVAFGFRPWDRYLLPLAPLLAWLAAERLSLRSIALPVLANVMLLVILLSSPMPGIGGRDGRWIGIDEMGTYLQSLPDDTTIYHRELGRPLAFYAPALENRLVWLPAGELPPPGSVWAGRRDDAGCNIVIWQSHGTLSVCRVGQ